MQSRRGLGCLVGPHAAARSLARPSLRRPPLSAARPFRRAALCEPPVRPRSAPNSCGRSGRSSRRPLGPGQERCSWTTTALCGSSRRGRSRRCPRRRSGTCLVRSMRARTWLRTSSAAATVGFWSRISAAWTASRSWPSTATSSAGRPPGAGSTSAGGTPTRSSRCAGRRSCARPWRRPSGTCLAAIWRRKPRRSSGTTVRPPPRLASERRRP
mmetsp:Transcript_36787/g.115735  ORF Transcript_36787/g.115735 Transcript_36787/m.115735 type:complete len:213 (+) Transcript_36787:164-802(+)